MSNNIDYDSMGKTSPQHGDPWKHRSKAMLCVTCMWFVEKEKQNETINDNQPMRRIGRCRRHAPTMNGYPVIFTTDWCGDHKLDENKI